MFTGAVSNAVRVEPKSQLIKPLVTSLNDDAPLDDAMIVIPCGDRIHEEIAKKRFGPNIIESWKVEEGHTCPTCLHPVEGCIVDNLTRKISTIVFSKPDYPGKSSKFKRRNSSFFQRTHC